MVIDDLRQLWKQSRMDAESAVESGSSGSPQIHLLPDFLEVTAKQRMSAAEKELIVDQATLVVEQLYAHLPFKRARYAVDPVQRLRILRHRGADLADLAFHSEMLSIFLELKDAHTFYGLPDPYRGAVAFLPFNLDAYVDSNGRRRFVIVNLLSAYRQTALELGSEVTFWNGMPIEVAVLQSGERSPASNASARFARGTRDLTVRSLTFSLPPEEHWVHIQYRPSDENDEERIAILPWCVGSNLGADLFHAARSLKKSTASVNDSVLDAANARKHLWCRHQVLREFESRSDYDLMLNQGASPFTYGPEPHPGEPTIEGEAVPESEEHQHITTNLEQNSLLPAAFRFQYTGGTPDDDNVDPDALSVESTPGARFGYIRILRFDHGIPDRFELTDVFFEEFLRIVDLMREKAPDGLILDVRGNPGGNIQDAERMLQLFSCRAIRPEVFYFANSLLSQRISETVQRASSQLELQTEDDERAQSIAVAASRFEALDDDTAVRLESGEMLSKGRPLTDPESANSLGQRYHGPVVLIADGTSYSATDIFAAGFQDHEIGPVVGIGSATGGGGANRWTHQEDLVEVIGRVPGTPFQALPKGAVIGFAVRRSLRVGSITAGQPIEDTGVECDEEYVPTKRDLTENFFDLVRFACGILAERPAFRLSIRNLRIEEDELRFRVESANLHRLELFVDERPQLTSGVADPPLQEFRIPLHELPSLSPASVTAHGVAKVDFARRLSDTGALEHVASARALLGA